MHTGKGQIVELILEDGGRLVRIACQPNLVPAPGQYLLASHASDSLLPVPVYYTDSVAEGFIGAPLMKDSWSPGQELQLRGPLGRGFELSTSARKVALVAFDASAVRLRGLIRSALRQDAAVVVVCNSVSERLPDEVEVQPLSALADVISWADYVALDTARETLHQLGDKLGGLSQLPAVREAQVLIRTAMPCGGVAECGVCAVSLKSGWKLACKDGPVLDWRELGEG
jgi:dihydroorotate dehydrogenase electron transfer subunit